MVGLQGLIFCCMKLGPFIVSCNLLVIIGLCLKSFCLIRQFFLLS